MRQRKGGATPPIFCTRNKFQDNETLLAGVCHKREAVSCRLDVTHIGRACGIDFHIAWHCHDVDNIASLIAPGHKRACHNGNSGQPEHSGDSDDSKCFHDGYSCLALSDYGYSTARRDYNRYFIQSLYCDVIQSITGSAEWIVRYVTRYVTIVFVR